MSRRPYTDEQLEERVSELRAVFDPPYADLARIVLHDEDDQEEGACLQCDAMRVLAREDPKLEHDATWEPGISGLMSMTYRAKCSCGWRDRWVMDRPLAELRGREHERDPQA
jgi:hypothetical protein